MQLSKCTMKWLLVTGLGALASKSSRLPPSQPSFARGRAPNNSITPKSSSHWCSRRLGHHLGSWRPHTRPRSPTCLCNVVVDWVTGNVPVSCLLSDFVWGILDYCFWVNLLSFCWIFSWWSFWYLSRMKQIYISVYPNLIIAEYRLEWLPGHRKQIFFHQITPKSQAIVDVENVDMWFIGIFWILNGFSCYKFVLREI